MPEHPFFPTCTAPNAIATLRARLRTEQEAADLGREVALAAEARAREAWSLAQAHRVEADRIEEQLEAMEAVVRADALLAVGGLRLIAGEQRP